MAVYLDEVDIHLNPKIGLDWMNRGTQKQVVTPGQNVKRYLCGAMDAETGLLTWVKAERKNSLLFVAMLGKLTKVYPDRVIHVVLDNYVIHDSKVSRSAVAAWGGRIVLYFLPRYCPQENKIGCQVLGFWSWVSTARRTSASRIRNCGPRLAIEKSRRNLRHKKNARSDH